MEHAQEPPARKWPQFSLRSLLLFVALCTSGCGLWYHWEPWPVHLRLKGVYPKDPLIVSFSLDGTRFVVPASEMAEATDPKTGKLELRQHGFAQVRDLRTGKVLMELRGHTNWLHGAQYLSDGKTIVTWSYDGTVRIWNAATGACRRVIAVPDHSIYDASISRDGKQIQTLARTPTDDWDDPMFGFRAVHNWDAYTGRKMRLNLKTWDGEPIPGPISGRVPIDEPWPSGRREVSAEMFENSYQVIVYDRVSGRALAVLPQRHGGIRGFQLAPDPDYVCVTEFGYATLYRRRRPEWWWGVAWLPEFWLTVVLAVGLAWSLLRERRPREN